MLKVFLDINNALDLILKRGKLYEHAVKIIEIYLDDQIEIFFPEAGITAISSITQPNLDKMEIDVSDIIDFLLLCTIASAPKNVFILGLKSGFKDKEDGQMYHIALHHGCDYFVTNNDSDFKPHAIESLPVLKPEEFVKLFT